MTSSKILNLIYLTSTTIINFVSILYTLWVRSKEYTNIFNKFTEVDEIVYVWQKPRASILFRYQRFVSQFLFVVIYVTIIRNWIYDSKNERLRYLVFQNVQRQHMITFQMHACHLICTLKEKIQTANIFLGGMKFDRTKFAMESTGGEDLTKIEELFLIFKDIASDMNIVFGPVWLFLFLSALVNFLTLLGDIVSGEYGFGDGIWNLIIVVSN